MDKLSAEQFLVQRGYLTLHQLVEYFRDNHPLLAMSYPSLKRTLIDTGKLDYIEVGGQKRILAQSIKDYVESVEGVSQPSPNSEAITTTDIEGDEDVTA